MKQFFVAAVLAVLALPAQAQQVQIDDSFATSDFTWSSGGGALIRWRPVVSGGKVLFCGAYANMATGTRTSRFNREVMRRATVVVGESTVLPNASFFAVVNRSFADQGLEGQMANCQDTGLTPDQARGMRLKFYEGRYRVRS